MSMVHFEKLNLKDVFAARRFGTFDMIMCRNVMIYFDDDMKKSVVKMFHNQLADDGTLAMDIRAGPDGARCRNTALQQDLADLRRHVVPVLAVHEAERMEGEPARERLASAVELSRVQVREIRDVRAWLFAVARRNALNARRTPKNLTRELWWIRLDEEAVDVYPCGRKGEPCAPMTRKSLPALFEALRNGLELLDRGEHYLRPPSAPEPSPDFHPRYRARPAYPGDFMPGLPPVPGEDAPRD